MDESAMSDDVEDKRAQSEHRFAHLDELHLGGVERKIENGVFVGGTELADALRHHGPRPIPDAVLDYLCRYLRGEVKRPGGRPTMPEVERRRLEMFVRWTYRRNLAWLQKRRKRYGHLDGWPRIRGTDFWRGPPSEKAARMAARRFWHGAESWRTVVNRSSRK